MDFVIYTDGASHGNKRDSDCPASCAWAIFRKDIPSEGKKTFVTSGSMYQRGKTNNQMEMQGILEGYSELVRSISSDIESRATLSQFMKETVSVEFVTDSKYVEDNFYEYLPDWKSNGWRKTNGSQILNVELWKQLDIVSSEVAKFSIRWVKGHLSDTINVAVDAMAQKAIQRGSTGYSGVQYRIEGDKTYFKSKLEHFPVYRQIGVTF